MKNHLLYILSLIFLICIGCTARKSCRYTTCYPNDESNFAIRFKKPTDTFVISTFHLDSFGNYNTLSMNDTIIKYTNLGYIPDTFYDYKYAVFYFKNTDQDIGKLKFLEFFKKGSCYSENVICNDRNDNAPCCK